MIRPKRAKAISALAVCAFLLIAVTWGLQSANRARTNERCEEQLPQIGAALTQYANDHRLYPPVPGRLMFPEQAMEKVGR